MEAYLIVAGNLKERRMSIGVWPAERAAFSNVLWVKTAKEKGKKEKKEEKKRKKKPSRNKITETQTLTSGRVNSK